MGIFRITASADNTISNAYNQTLSIRATGSNMGASDILEVFTIYGQQASSSVEKSRILIEFPLNAVPSSTVVGSREFYLCMKNARHSEAVPDDFKLFVSPVSQSWEEGFGLDMAEYSDLTYNKEGSNWIQARLSASNADDGKWTSEGGDYLYAQAKTASFATGLEDIKLDVTSIVEKWITGSSGGGYNNYGFGIQLSTSEEAETKSFYTKKFFGRGSEYYLNRPYLEVRWNDATKDDRGSFYASSSLAPAADNLNTIYLYNRIRGRLEDIPVAPTSASLRYTTTGANQASAAVTRESKGIYKASLSLETTASTIYDVWYSGSTAYHTGTISVNSFAANTSGEDSKYVVSIVNNQHEYRSTEQARFKVYTRYKNWSPNIYTVAQKTPENLIIEDAVYKVVRIVDGEEIIPYETSSLKSTQLSYNVSGNYFDLDMSNFEKNYQYGIKLAFYNDYLSNYAEQPYIFKFRVV